MPTLDNIVGGKIKINGVEYNLVEITYGGTGQVIWPTSQPVTYVIEDVTIHYSSSNQILASAANYAWVTATVKKYRGSTLVETTTNVTVAPTLTSGQHFYVSGNYIYGHDLEKNEVLVGYSDTISVTYETASVSNAVTVYQQENEAGNPYNSEISAKNYDYEHATVIGTETGNPTASLEVFNYTSPSSPCPAAGGSFNISATATYDTRDRLSVPWTRTITYYFYWTSGAPDTNTQNYDSGNDNIYTEWETIGATPSVTFSENWLGLRSGSTTIVDVDSRGTIRGVSNRIAYITASYNGASSQNVYVYQQYNDIESYSITGVSLSVVPDDDTIDFTAQTVNCYGYITRTRDNVWTSLAHSQSEDNIGNMRVYLNSSSSYETVISNGEYYPYAITENETLQDRSFTIRLAYILDGTTYYSDPETITQERGIITYGIPVIYSYDCDMIPASGTEPGDSVSPYGYARQPYYINGHQNPDGYEYPEVSWYPASFTAQSLGTTETSTPTYIGSSTGSCTAHGKSATQVSVDCYQEINEKFYNGSTVGEKQYGTPYVGQTYYQNPQITSFTSDAYSSSASACSAAGGTAQLSATARFQIRYQMITPWSQTTTEHYIFSSGSPLDVPTTVTSYDVSYTQWSWTSVTPTLSGSGTGFSLDTDSGEVTISNRGNQTGAAAAARSATFTASYTTPDSSLSDSRTITLYQEANEAYPKYEPIHSLSIQHTGNIPASGGTYTVNYVARKETWTEYSSGYETTHVTSAETLSVDGFNCTPSVNSISGAGSFTIAVGQNGSSSRTVTVSAGDASDYRTQDAAASVYTMVLEYNNVVIQNNGYIEADGQTIYIYDTGNNARNYTITKETGSALSITFDSANARFFVTHIDSSTLEWVQIYESSSNTTIRFQIYGYS